MAVVEIFAVYEGAADEKLAKLAKRGAKYGQVIAWRKEPFARIEKRKRWDGKVQEREVPMIRYHVEGEAPRVGEFKFLAELERAPGAGVFVHGAEVGAIGREWDGACQHCHQPRARKHGYVVEGADGRRLVVGKACLRDYVGQDVPAGALWLFQFEKAVGGLPDEDGGAWGYAGRWEDEVLGVVAAARAVIALYGWEPRSAEGFCSADRVSAALWPIRGEAVMKRKVKAEVLAELAARGDHYEAVAAEVIEWARNLQPRSDYEHNLKIAASAEFCDGKRFGLVVSAAAAFDRQVARDAERAEKAAERAKEAAVSKWFGEPGAKYEAELVMLGSRRISGQWGDNVLFSFKAPGGELIKWFCSGAIPRVAGKPIEVGDKIKAKFAVKKHGEFNGLKESVVLRLKVA